MMSQRSNFRPTSLATQVASIDDGREREGNLLSHTRSVVTPLGTCKSIRLNRPLDWRSSILRRLLIGLATWRLTSATTVTTSFGFLATLLKSLLVGCYYVLAFVSLLLFILYINQVASTQNLSSSSSRIRFQDHNQLNLESDGSVISMATLVKHPVDEDYNKNSLTSASLYYPLAQPSRRFKRSLAIKYKKGIQLRILEQLDQNFAPKNVQQHRNRVPLGINQYLKAVFVRQPNGRANGLGREADLRRSDKPASSMFVQKTPSLPTQAGRLSEQSNRDTGNPQDRTGSLVDQRKSNGTTRQLVSATESQWIPIMSPQVSPHASNSDMLAELSLQKVSSDPRRFFDDQRHRTRSSTEIIRNFNRRNNYHFNHRPPQQGRQWRRPKFNADIYDGLQPRRVYKRVLLCDKTLVSLDYIRTLRAEPRPFLSHNLDNDDDFNDNFIDLESNLDEIANINRRLVNESQLQSAPRMSFDASQMDFGGETSNFVRQSYLPDDQPLVKCDMWDLEKGLKNRRPPDEILRMAIRADFDTVRDAINRCRQLTEKSLPPEDEYRDGLDIMSTEDLISLFSMKRGLIPGTKWCGLGDQAGNYNDLGPKHRIDICCRAHDHCPIRLKPFRNDYGVLNIALYTKSHCDCDADFYRCLREVHSRTADMLGNLYFNVMKLQCMREERMKVCIEMK